MPSWARIIELPARVWRKTVEVGPLYALQLIYWEIFPSWLFDLNVWIVTVKEIQAYSEIRNHDSAIRWADENDMDALTLCGLNRTKIASSFERDGKIAVLEREGRIIAYAQYGTAAHEQDDWLIFKLKPHDVYGAGVWVAPDHRGQRIAAQLIAFARSHFARAGCQRSIGLINALNQNSRRAHVKVGITEFGRIFYLRLLGLEFLRYGRLHRIGRWHSQNRLEILLVH